jgi:hypothetical protein
MGKGKDIGPGIVTAHIKGHRVTIDQGKIQVGNDQFPAILDRGNNVV